MIESDLSSFESIRARLVRSADGSYENKSLLGIGVQDKGGERIWRDGEFFSQIGSQVELSKNGEPGQLGLLKILYPTQGDLLG
jgi:hypothetical protein